MDSSTITHQQDGRVLLNSKEFSLLFLDENSPSSLDIPYQDLSFGTKIGSGGFKDCYQGKTIIQYCILLVDNRFLLTRCLQGSKFDPFIHVT